ncbi:hypothetical protein BACCAP_00334 [Pseudoflavonifractor capillosus ATCC 29799]|uniref:Uncharacterized protein n=1 Tax=Pseudoflavonifractor capillosus ATCC 29799 TaxID=411467 RepID=A6NQ65_9FIRM|nr:hypothetical protein BACCAP_00334 [Pseudoflavonifractor capillosus ATCC 29799]
MKTKVFKPIWLCSSARVLNERAQNPCTFRWCIEMHQRKYALQQYLNFIKAASLSRFYEIARLSPWE